MRSPFDTWTLMLTAIALAPAWMDPFVLLPMVVAGPPVLHPE